MLEYLDLSKGLFLDIETVPQQANYEELDDDWKALWRLKAKSILRKYDEELSEEEVSGCYDRAGIYAEFGKIVCISSGIMVRDNDGRLMLRLKSFAQEDEKELLSDFSHLVSQYYNNVNTHFFCGHNIKEFDMPYICRRMVAHQLELPDSLHIPGKKPWELKHFVDTLELWKFGDYKHYTSLRLLSAVLGFPSPKDDIDGSDVGRVYWEEKDLNRIALYCERDVLATVQLMLRYMRQPILEGEQIVYVDRE